MKNARFLATAAFLAAAALPGAASAQTAATATAELNVRSGPGPQHPVIGVIAVGDTVTVNGCLEGSRWCTLDHGGVQGWVYSDYLMADLAGSPVVVTDSYAQVGVPVATYDDSATEAGATAGVATGAASGAIAGALIAGPIGAVVGGVAGAAAGGVTGAAAGALIDPPAEVRTYVTTNQVEPVYLEGEVVVGAGLPDNVELRTIPNYQYNYVYVNGLPVLVDPSNRQIVYVVR